MRKTGVANEHVQAVFTSRPHDPSPSLPAPLASVLAYTDAMTLTVRVPDDVYATLKHHFNEREVVEITATVAAYNCVSRFLVALDVGERNSQTEPLEGGKE